jgi:hypothetical protein
VTLQHVVGQGANYHKNLACYEMLHRALDLAGPFERGNKPLGSIKGEEFLD